MTNATNLAIIGQTIDQTFLIDVNEVSICSVQYSQGLKLTSFSIDYDPLPFTAGFVVHVDDQYLNVQVVPPHQTDIGRQVHAILRYDPQDMRPAFDLITYEIYQKPSDNVNTSVVPPGIVRIPLIKRTKFLKGVPVVARFLQPSGSSTIHIQDITDLIIQSITIYTSWSIGILTLRARRFNLIDYHVIHRSGRWMSSAADCTHLVDTREYVSVIDNETNHTGALDVGVGTNLEFSFNQQPFSVHGNRTISTTVFKSVNSRKITFTKPVNVHFNDWVCVADTPRLTIRNFTVSHNRARGVLLETRNIDIRHSIFNKTSRSAILIQPSMRWHEGLEARNLSLINNLYVYNNEGVVQREGIITILPDLIQLVPLINDLRIESLTFYFGTYSQDLLQSDNANNIFISGNYIATNNSTSSVSICNSRNISTENNCVINLQTKIDTYYTYDETTPCSKNLIR